MKKRKIPSANGRDTSTEIESTRDASIKHDGLTERESKNETDASIELDASRRKFAKRVVALSATVLSVKTLAMQTGAQTTTAPPATPETPPARPAPQVATPPRQTSPLADKYMEVARVKFGDKLNDEELARVRRDLESYVRTSERLSATKLQNSDEPDFAFKA